MKRNIISIDEEACNGCGLCVTACHEGALQMVNGKAKLITDSYCDGLGACLPECPTGAIRIEEREADAFDEEAVKARMAALDAELHMAQAQTAHAHNGHAQAHTHSDHAQAQAHAAHTHSGHAHAAPAAKAGPEYAGGGCPGSRARTIERPAGGGCPGSAARSLERTSTSSVADNTRNTPAIVIKPESQLRQWPVQIKLVPVKAPYLHQANILVAADCTAFAYANIHNDFMKNRITLIGCPKLDEGDYADKFTAILQNNEIKSITVLRMEVPCCGGITHAVQRALMASGKMIPWQVVTVGTNGEILEN